MSAPTGPRDLRGVWQASWLVVAVLALAALGVAFVRGAGSTIFVLVVAFFAATALEPVVGRLTRAFPRLPRSSASALVLVALLLAVGAFFAVFGAMLADQVAGLIDAAPSALDTVLRWINGRFGTAYTLETILAEVGLTQEAIKSYAGTVAGQLLTIVGGVASSLFNAFTFVFFMYYFSAGLPALRAWVAGLLPPRRQIVFLTSWDTMLAKVGSYVASRMVLAVICGTATGIGMVAIGMPYWLPLAIWTGVVAQFVPNVGTYIAIALPTLVGLASEDPRDGLFILVFGIAYQQVENIFIEPRISSRAVDVHPATSFAAALIGAQLFGLAGAALGVPVAATAMALFDLYKRRWDVTAETEREVSALIRREAELEQPAGPDPAAAAGGRSAGEVSAVEAPERVDGR